MASGKNTKQYNVVLTNMGRLVGDLQADTARKDALGVQFVQKKWIAPPVKKSEKDLINLALNRIENDAAEYDVFIAMLNTVVGMDLTVKAMTGVCAVATMFATPQGASSSEGAAGIKTDGSEEEGLMCYADWMMLDDDGKGDELWASGESYLWGKKLIKVRFMNPIPGWRNENSEFIRKDDILGIANEWHQCGKEVVPKFVLCGDDCTSDIRIQFKERGTSSSYVGTFANSHQGEPTMWLNLTPKRQKGDILYKGTIRHEFGHALGMEHEHQHKDAPPIYDEEELKKHVELVLKNQGKDHSEAAVKEKIRTQWAKILAPTPLRKAHDKNSVMHYAPIPKVQHPNYGGPLEQPCVLSELDKKYIVEFYSGAEDDKSGGPDSSQKEGTLRPDGPKEEPPVLSLQGGKEENPLVQYKSSERQPQLQVEIKLTNATNDEGTIRSYRPHGIWTDMPQVLPPNENVVIAQAEGNKPLLGSFIVQFPNIGTFKVSFDTSAPRDNQFTVTGGKDKSFTSEPVLWGQNHMLCKLRFH